MKADVTAENKPAYLSQINTRFIQRSRYTWNNAHKYQRATQVFVIFLDEVAVVVVGCALELIVEFDAGVTGPPEKARKESRQCFK